MCISQLTLKPNGVQRAVMKATVTGLLKESKNHLNKQWEGSEDYLRVHLILLEVVFQLLVVAIILMASIATLIACRILSFTVQTPTLCLLSC